MIEVEFDVGDMVLRGKRWGTPGARPVIALHGWLDNCASFDYLAPLLKSVDLLALDLAGQGRSDHRRHTGAYNIWLDIKEVISVAERMNWDKFALLGHSRGAMISTMIAGTFPERISHLALVESFAPQMLEASEAPEQMASAISTLLNIDGKRRSEFTSFEEAVKAREQGLLKLVHQDALVLAQRGVVEKHGKFFWNNDIKLNVPSEVKFTPEQVRAFVDRIRIPIVLIVGEQGLMDDFPFMKTFVDETANIAVHTFAGDHHLHMSSQSQQIARVFNEYFAN